jgi:hypothetical protein
VVEGVGCGGVVVWGVGWCCSGVGVGGGGVGCVVVWVGMVVWVVWGCGGVEGAVWGGFPLRSNIPRSAICATLDTYNF